EAHGALAAVSDDDTEADSRAWHRSLTSPGADEDVAAELERSATRAQERGGHLACAGLLERSAALSPNAGRAALRLLAAAGAYLGAGHLDRARALLERGRRHLEDPTARAAALRIEGAIRFAEGRGADTPRLLFEAAQILRGHGRE